MNIGKTFTTISSAILSLSVLSGCGESNSSSAEKRTNLGKADSVDDADEIFRVLSQKIGLDGWALCAAASTSINVLDARDGSIPDDYVRMNENLAFILNKIKENLLSDGITDQQAQAMLAAQGKNIVSGDDAAATVNSCVENIAIIKKDNVKGNTINATSKSAQFTEDSNKKSLNQVYEKFMHNGSEMAVYRHDTAISIAYLKPREGLIKTGVKSGDLVFAGMYVGDIVEGTAYSFKKGCEPAPYDVNGADAGDTIRLSGAAPVRANGNCQIVSYNPNSGNANLTFTIK